MTPSTNRIRVVVASLVMIALAGGAAAGVVVDRMTAPRLKIRTIGDMSGVFDKLGLTAVQRRTADSIVTASAPRTEAIMTELGERLRGVADSIDVELRQILTPDQRTRLDSLKSGMQIMLKRKTIGPGGTRVDTLLETGSKKRGPPPE